MLKKMCQLAWGLNSDRYNNSRTLYHSPTALTAFCCIQFSMYLAEERAVGVACARWAWRARGGRGVRAVGVATLNANSVKKAKDKRKKSAIQM